MWNSRLVGVAAAAALCAWAPSARAQSAQGFDAERLYPSAPGAGWLVMDSLDMRGGVGATAGLTAGYSHGALRVPTSDGSHLSVVSRSAFAQLGLAVTYDRFRLYLNLTSPLVNAGDGGTVGGTTFTPPAVDPGSHPDVVADPRIGFDARLLGAPGDAFRLGAGAQLLVPNGATADYDSDGTLRAIVRALVAGDVGVLTYAGQLGVHIRPRDDGSTPGGPQGSELLFGAAAGARLTLGPSAGAALIIGPEVFGETALRSPFGASTGVEALLTSRVEGTADRGAQVRVKLGTGGGLVPQFGAPEWRFVVGIEVFDRGGGRGAATDR